MGKELQSILSVRVDFNFSDPCYVLRLASSWQDGSTDANVAAALSNNAIKVYRHHIADLQQLCVLERHKDRITDVALPLIHAPSLVLSSSDDGTVRAWDSRSGTCEETYICHNEEAYSCACTDDVVAAGSDGTVWFWDRRKRKVLRKMADTHMDMVTVAKFHPHKPHLFFSGSDDGLIAAFDFSQSFSEDEGFVAAVNARNAPTELQFFGPDKGRLWCRSATETLHLWDWSTSISEQAADYMAVEEDPNATPDSCDIMDIREQLNSALQGDRGPFQGQVDYVVGCHEGGGGHLFVAAGSSAGSLSMFNLSTSTDAPQCQVSGLAMHLCGGHSDVIRSQLVHGDVVVTGGEDARMCVWADPLALEERAMSATDSGGAAPPPAPIGTLSERHKPY